MSKRLQDDNADPAANLLRLFKAQADHRAVVTRQDLNRDYYDNDSDATIAAAAGHPEDSVAGPPEYPIAEDDNGVAAAVTVNNYHTWNSSRTNPSILKYARVSPVLHFLRPTTGFLCGVSCNLFARLSVPGRHSSGRPEFASYVPPTLNDVPTSSDSIRVFRHLHQLRVSTTIISSFRTREIFTASQICFQSSHFTLLYGAT